MGQEDKQAVRHQLKTDQQFNQFIKTTLLGRVSNRGMLLRVPYCTEKLLSRVGQS